MDKRAVGAWLALLLAVVVGIVLGVSLDGDEEAQAAPWERVPLVSQRRSYIAAASWTARLSTRGRRHGRSAGRPLATVASRYDATADRWEVLPRLPVETRGSRGCRDRRPGSTSSAGTTPEGNTDAVWAYDPRPARSRIRGARPAPRSRASTTPQSRSTGRVWVLGGYLAGPRSAARSTSTTPPPTPGRTGRPHAATRCTPSAPSPVPAASCG